MGQEVAEEYRDKDQRYGNSKVMLYCPMDKWMRACSILVHIGYERNNQDDDDENADKCQTYFFIDF